MRTGYRALVAGLLVATFAALAPFAAAQPPAAPAQAAQVPPPGPDSPPPAESADAVPKADANPGEKKEEKEKNEEQKPDPKAEALKMGVSWKDGLWAETADKNFRVHVGGRTQFDAIWMVAPENVQWAPPVTPLGGPMAAGGVGRVDDAVNFRRARLAVEGTFYKVIDFNCEYDFLNTFIVTPLPPGAPPGALPRLANVPVPTDLFVTFKELPLVGNIKAGNQKPPLSFEHLTSSRWLNFMERSIGFDAFVEDQNNGFRPGIQAFDTALGERATWAVGLFKQTRSIFGWNTGDGEADVTGRVTLLPVWREDGRRLVHLGLGASHRDLDDHVARLRGRTALRNGPAFLHTLLVDASIVGSSQQVVVPEFVVVWGPWSLQSEYFMSWVQNAQVPVVAPPRVNQGTVFFHAFYVEAHYFLTGEHRPYNRKNGSFTRVVPRRNARWDRQDCEAPGRGAWQVAARYQFVDLNDKGVLGGEVHESTYGLNWFLNPNLKVQWNYSLAYRFAPNPAADGFIHGFGMTTRFDF